MLVITPFVIVGVTVTPAELPPPPEIDTTGFEEYPEPPFVIVRVPVKAPALTLASDADASAVVP